MDQDQAVIRKVLWRLVPFCILCYLLNYIDRVNISIAKLKMVYVPAHDGIAATGIPGFTEDVYSVGAAVFFLGYCLFEVPSNLIMERVGARRWIARIMISWGLLTTCFVFTRGPWSFYGLRILLGLAEAGFLPGMILYLSYWIPHHYRAQASALFLTSTAISGVIGNPLGGLILYATEARPLGLANWQWLFLSEGIPSVILGLGALFLLTDRPAGARWLTPDERSRLQGMLAREHAEHPAHDRAAFADAFRSPHTWLLSLLYGMVVYGFYIVNLYTPTILKKALDQGHVTGPGMPPLQVDLYVCLLSAIPFGAAAIGMVVIGKHSDRRDERKFHLAFTCGLIALGLGLAALAPSLAGWPGMALVMIGLCIAAVGAFGLFGPFWALPSQFLTGSAAAAAFAIINSIGNFCGGFGGPYLQTRLGMQGSLLLGCGLAAGAGLLALAAPNPKARKMADAISLS